MKAFPKTPFVEIGTPQNGMDLRDYFAAQAIQAIITKYGLGYEEGNVISAYRIADLMMKARGLSDE